MKNWFELQYLLKDSFKHMAHLGQELESEIDDFEYVLSTSMNLQELATIKIRIDVLVNRMLQQLIMASDGNEQVITDIKNFKKWISEYEDKMTFIKKRETSYFVFFIALMKIFLESYYYDALDKFARSMHSIADILHSRAGVIIEPKAWTKETFKVKTSGSDITNP